MDNVDSRDEHDGRLVDLVLLSIVVDDPPEEEAKLFGASAMGQPSSSLAFLPSVFHQGRPSILLTASLYRVHSPAVPSTSNSIAMTFGEGRESSRSFPSRCSAAGWPRLAGDS